MFELCGATAVCGDCSPVVIPHQVLPGSERDHRFDGEDHARFHDHGVARVEVVQNLNVGVELLTDAVTNERAHDTHFVFLGVILDGFTDDVEWFTGLNRFDTQPQAFFGDPHQTAVLVADLANEEGGIGVAMNSVDEAGDVEIDDVTVFKDGAVGDAMTDHFIQGGAHALGIAVIIEWAGIGATFDGEIVDQDIDVVRGDTWFHEVTRQPQDIGRHGAGVAHAVDDIGRLHMGFVPALYFAGLGIRGFGDGARYRALGRDFTGQDATLDAAMATTVLAPGTAPAGVIQLRGVLRSPNTPGSGGHAPEVIREHLVWFSLLDSPALGLIRVGRISDSAS